jgi:polyisoprenoid-binding protein YceI
VRFLTLALALAVSEPYRLVPEESRFEVEVGRAGLFKMFGHDHRIEVRSFTGRVDWSSDRPQDSSFRLEVDALSLTVADESLSEKDRGQVQADMETKALAVSEHPRIVFQSTEVQREKPRGAAYELKLVGTLELRGVSRSIQVPVAITEEGGRLRVVGEVEIDASKWGVPQIAALGGSVKTAEKLALSFDLVAVR